MFSKCISRPLGDRGVGGNFLFCTPDMVLRGAFSAQHPHSTPAGRQGLSLCLSAQLSTPSPEEKNKQSFPGPCVRLFFISTPTKWTVESLDFWSNFEFRDFHTLWKYGFHYIIMLWNCHILTPSNIWENWQFVNFDRPAERHCAIL